MAHQGSSDISLFFKDPSVDNYYRPVERKDQLEAIKNYLTTGKPSQSVPHYLGGMFTVEFEDLPRFYYKKSDGTRVEILFGTSRLTNLINRVMIHNGGSRRRHQTSKRSKRVRGTMRRYRK
jgi:hypothetical protein